MRKALKTLQKRICLVPHGSTLRQHIGWLHAFYRYTKDLSARPLPPTNPEGQFTAVILSYKRPQNIQWICRSLLATPAISRVILKNNYPGHCMKTWLPFRHERLEVIEQEQETNLLCRYTIAKDSGADQFVFIDDDIFLTPEQIEHLCTEYLADPTAPHGMFGQRLLPSGDFEYNVINYEGHVDVLNRLYVLGRHHVESVLECARALEQSGYAMNAFKHDDMLLGLCSTKRPISHNIGLYLDCPTESASMAVWRQSGFFEQRAALAKRIQARSAITKNL